MKDLFKKIFYKIFSFKIVLLSTKGNKYTLYKEIHKKFNIDPKLMKEVCQLYGPNMQNLVEYYKDGKTAEGYTIWKIKQKL